LREPGRNERGFVAIELAAGVALLVFPIAMLVATLPAWFDRQSLARQSARDAARAVVLDGVCRDDVASPAALRIARGGGVASNDVRVVLDCAPGRALARDGHVTARVTVEIPAVSVPLVGSVGTWRWTAVHSEPVDPYGSQP
jgi:hypothetical protein